MGLATIIMRLATIIIRRRLLTGSPCQQCIIDRENINQSEVTDDAANSSISYTCCLLNFSKNINSCVSPLPKVHNMRLAS